MPTQNVTLPVWGSGPVLVRAVQGEADSRTVAASLTDASGAPVDLTGAAVQLFAHRPDGTDVFWDGTLQDAAGGLCAFTLPSGATSVPGISPCQLLVSWQDGRALKTAGLLLEVLPSDLESAVEADDNFSALVSALGDARQAAQTAAQASADAILAAGNAQQAVTDGRAAVLSANAAAMTAAAAANTAETAAGAANQAAQSTGAYYRMINPLTGETAFVTDVISGLTVYIFRNSISAQTMDSLGKSVGVLDAAALAAVDFDTDAKTILGGS